MRKKILSLLLCASLLTGMTAALTSCSNTQNEPSGSTDSAAPETEAPTEEEVVIEPFEEMTASELVANIRIGWNLGNTLDSAVDAGLLIKLAETHWGNPMTTQEMIDEVAAAGFNAVRIPVTWYRFAGAAPDYTINTIWLERVKEVVDYCIANDMYVIINMHHEEWIDLTYEEMSADMEQFTAMWEQIATYFRGYDEHLIFEGMNEPRRIGTSIEWTGGDDQSRACVNQLNAAFVETVRATGGNNDKRLLMIPSYAASSAEVALAAVEIPDDDMIAVSVHAYIPYSFALASPGTSDWDIETDTGEIDSLLANLDKYFLSKGVPVILGEMGSQNKDNLEARCACAEYYISKAAEYNVPCFWWDNNAFSGDGENFGLLNRRTLEWEFPELVDSLMNASEIRVQE